MSVLPHMINDDQDDIAENIVQKPILKIASGDVEEKFQEKMGKVALKEKEVETQRFAGIAGFPYINLEKFPVSQQALRQISEDDAVRLGAVCFFATQDEVRMGAIDPSDQEVQDLLYQIAERNHVNSGLYTISEASFSHVLELYKTLPNVKPITKDVSIREEELEKYKASVNDFESFQKEIQGKTATEIVTAVMGVAMKLGSSDVHIEAEEKQVMVRFRLDGILHDAATLARETYKGLISRIKLISSLKINISDKPQDGRFTIKLSSGDVDVRVSTLPTVYGESIVMRLLVQSKKGLTLDDLGIRGPALVEVKRQVERPNGMIITTGPTGSGKTTTLYAMMQGLNEPGVKILTLEDPVEYKMQGVNQSQIDLSRDYTFAKGLRSMLRQDPDIAMVGEIRDLETADIAIQAALTGHLILSTIHTNSASGAIPRFLSMGVKPFLLAPALNCVIGQRLIRKICQFCKKEITLDQETLDRVAKTVAEMPEAQQKEVETKAKVFYTGVGCDKCNGIGYKGRIGIYEIFVMNKEIEEIVLSAQVSEYEIERIAVRNGMVTMVQDGVLKAMDGLTSLDEVFRVIE